MLKLTISFIVAILIRNTSSTIKEDFLNALTPQGSLKEDIVLKVLNLTYYFERLNEEIFDKNHSIDLERDSFVKEKEALVCINNNATNCKKKDEQYDSTLGHLTRLLFSGTPTLDFSSSKEISEACRRDNDRYKQDLMKFKFWALKMYDAGAKLPSGFLSGNINQLGDFDLCLSANSQKWNIKGQYCLASFQVESPKNLYLTHIHKLIHAHYLFKSKIGDPGHRVPRFSSINWAFCLPSSCTAKDIETSLQKSLVKFNNATSLEIQIEVDPIMCQNSEKKPIPLSTIFVASFFIGVVLLVLIATFYDFHEFGKNEFLLAFSLRKNLVNLLSTDRPINDIEAVHGIRFLNAFMLLYSHKTMALFFVPFINRTEMSEILGKPWTVFGRAASLYTDPFIMISATLTSYSYFRKLQKTNSINILNEYTSRLFRIVPTLGALILFCTFVLPWLNAGPQWNLVVTEHADNCKKYWWRNMLFIHNYFGFKDMCLTHTHHVGIDTQLFFVSPLLILPLWKWPKQGMCTLISLALGSTLMRYYVTYTMKLNNYVHFGTSIQQLFDTADNMYILPLHRATVYIMGIILAFILYHYKTINLTSLQIFWGNITAFLCFCISFIGPSFMGNINYVYNPLHAALYAAFAPILWCLSFAWIIFKTHVGQEDIFGWFFSRKIFLISTRLSYCIYLTQFPIFFYNVGITRTSEHYNFCSKTFNWSELSWIIIFSVLLTLLFESPFQNIRNKILKKESKLKNKTS